MFVDAPSMLLPGLRRPLYVQGPGRRAPLAKHLRHVDLVVLRYRNTDSRLVVGFLENVLAVSLALHPAAHALSRKIFESIPGVGLHSSSCTDAAVEISLVQILGKAFGKVASKIFFAPVTGQLSSCSRVPPLGSGVTEE